MSLLSVLPVTSQAFDFVALPVSAFGLLPVLPVGGYAIDLLVLLVCSRCSRSNPHTPYALRARFERATRAQWPATAAGRSGRYRMCKIATLDSVAPRLQPAGWPLLLKLAAMRGVSP